jgi:hypothetical protein
MAPKCDGVPNFANLRRKRPIRRKALTLADIDDCVIEVEGASNGRPARPKLYGQLSERTANLLTYVDDWVASFRAEKTHKHKKIGSLQEAQSKRRKIQATSLLALERKSETTARTSKIQSCLDADDDSDLPSLTDLFPSSSKESCKFDHEEKLMEEHFGELAESIGNIIDEEGKLKEVLEGNPSQLHHGAIEHRLTIVEK